MKRVRILKDKKEEERGFYEYRIILDDYDVIGIYEEAAAQQLFISQGMIDPLCEILQSMKVSSMTKGKKNGKSRRMGNQEERQYQVFEYRCPHCGLSYKEANSVKKHPDFQVCPRCGKRPK